MQFVFTKLDFADLDFKHYIYNCSLISFFYGFTNY